MQIQKENNQFDESNPKKSYQEKAFKFRKRTKIIMEYLIDIGYISHA